MVSDALVRKCSVKDANEEYVMQLRVPDNAMADQIQSALYKLFNSNNQSFQGTQCHSQWPQGIFLTMNGSQVHEHDNFNIKPSVVAPTAVLKLQLDKFFGNSLYSLLNNEAPYDDIITELEGVKSKVEKTMNFINKWMEFWQYIRIVRMQN